MLKGSGFIDQRTGTGANGDEGFLQDPVELARVAPFRFAGLLIEPALTQIVNADGTAEHLEPRVMQVLVALLRAEGAILTRGDLIQSCWGGVHVGDDAISRVIARIRHVAAGIGENRFTVETLPRVGYRVASKTLTSETRTLVSPYLAVLAAARRIAGGAQAPAEVPQDDRASVSRRVVLGGGAAVAVAGVGGWTLLKPSSGTGSDSIAVLPFANLSGDPAQAFFSDGIAEELRSALTRIAGLKVIGRTSSEAVRDDDAETAARKLGVANILTGSVRQSPSTIRISAQLIDVRNGTERWSQNYDRAPGDSIKIQTDIAENVARALSLALGSAARAAITVGGTSNAEAQRLLLHAYEFARGTTKAEFQRALTLVDAAIDLDPKYANAYARKSMYLTGYFSLFASATADFSAYRSQALENAKLALRLAPDLGIGHSAMGYFHSATLNIAPALTHYSRALELDPGHPTVIRFYANFVAGLGRATESFRLVDQAMALDPLNSHSHNAQVNVLMAARRYAEAFRFGAETLRKSPHLFFRPERLGWSLVLLGRYREAQHYFDLAAADNSSRLVGEAVLLIRTGRGSQVESRVSRIQEAYGDKASYRYAQIYAQLGEKDRAFAALDRGWQIRDAGLFNLKVDEVMDPLRSDPRFGQLMKKLNFPA